MSDTTEGRILSSIPDLDDNTPDIGNDDAQDNSTPQADDSNDTAAPFATDKPAAPVAAPDSGSGTPNTPTQPAAPTVGPQAGDIQRRDGLVERANKDNPNTRDIVDPKTGQIVARGGVERRYFETAQKLHRDNNQLTQRLQTAEANANHANAIVQLGTQLQLQPSDQTAALNLMSQFLKDPVKMLEALVIEVKSKGYEIPFLANGITPGMDTAAVGRMIDQRMAPLTAQQQQQRDAEQTQANAKATLDKFLDDNPEGEHNLGVLAEMMTSQPGLTIQDAHVKFIKWCAQNQYDFTQPLKPQIEARNNQQPTTTTVQNQQPRTPTAPLPNGRQTNNAAPIDSVVKFDENSRWEDIIRQSAKEAGFSSVN